MEYGGILQASVTHVIFGGVQCSGEGHFRSHGDEALGHALHPRCGPHCPEGRAMWPWCSRYWKTLEVDMAEIDSTNIYQSIWLVTLVRACETFCAAWLDCNGCLLRFCQISIAGLLILIWKNLHVMASSCRQIEACVNGTNRDGLVNQCHCWIFDS